MLIAIGMIAGFASIIILIVRFNFLKSDNKKRLCTLTWLVSLLVSGVSLAVDASKTYIPDVLAVSGYWVSRLTGRRVDTVYEVVKAGSGISPYFMFLIAIVLFVVCGLAFAGSIATGRNMASCAAKIPSKILSFLIWFFLCFIPGMLTLGITPIILAKQSGTPSSISRKMKIFVIISTILFLYAFFSRLTRMG